MSASGGGILDTAFDAPKIGPSDRLGSLMVWARLYQPRLRNRQFWIVQGLVITVAGLHLLGESLRIRGYLGVADYAITFIATALLYIPVVYAAFSFGFPGSSATSVLCIVLTIPDAVLFHVGQLRLVLIFQLMVFGALSILIGQWAEREARARKRAEAATIACGASEMKYRGLFESSPVAILIADSAGVILDANPAACALFEQAPSGLRARSIADLLGPTGAGSFLGTSTEQDSQTQYLVTLKRADGSHVYLDPTSTWIGDAHGRNFVQILLRDVTQEHQRQTGLRAYAAKTVRTQEEERRRLAQELHDEVVQQLVLLCRKLDLVEGGAEPLSPRVIAELSIARGSAEEAVKRLREFAKTLRPPALDDLGLVTCVRRLVVDCAERTGIDGRMTVAGEERRLPPEVELGLFRVAQEATRNVERHARASALQVKLAFAASMVQLEVADDGAGFSLPPATDFAAEGHLGLLGMRERAESLNGTLEIQSSPGVGTRVIVSVPSSEEKARTAISPR